MLTFVQVAAQAVFGKLSLTLVHFLAPCNVRYEYTCKKNEVKVNTICSDIPTVLLGRLFRTKKQLMNQLECNNAIAATIFDVHLCFHHKTDHSRPWLS